ncbi:hypothetical protein H4S00_001916 [Coemansia sp. D1744]|nr:hypothetical protein H4S00_001916 [Coemansia sp. D1744]
MARIIDNITLFVVASVVVMASTNEAESHAPANMHHSKMFYEPCGYANDYEGHCYHDGHYEGRHYDGHYEDRHYDGNYEGEHHFSHRPPQVTVHVIQPPPTFIYDVTQTACYTEHRDCCGCSYVCGPTCIPQGEVLAPNNIYKHVVVSDKCCHKRKHKN